MRRLHREVTTRVLKAQIVTLMRTVARQNGGGTILYRRVVYGNQPTISILFLDEYSHVSVERS